MGCKSSHSACLLGIAEIISGIRQPGSVMGFGTQDSYTAGVSELRVGAVAFVVPSLGPLQASICLPTVGAMPCNVRGPSGLFRIILPDILAIAPIGCLILLTELGFPCCCACSASSVMLIAALSLAAICPSRFACIAK